MCSISVESPQHLGISTWYGTVWAAAAGATADGTVTVRSIDRHREEGFVRVSPEDI